jgi:hypothetical protein
MPCVHAKNAEKCGFLRPRGIECKKLIDVRCEY